MYLGFYLNLMKGVLKWEKRFSSSVTQNLTSVRSPCWAILYQATHLSKNGIRVNFEFKGRVNFYSLNTDYFNRSKQFITE